MKNVNKILTMLVNNKISIMQLIKLSRYSVSSKKRCTITLANIYHNGFDERFYQDRACSFRYLAVQKLTTSL